MHRYREFGLVSDEDETLRQAFRDGFRRAGLSHRQFVDALEWYRDHVRAGADETALMQAFSEFAAQKNWSQELVDGVVGVYESIRDGGPDSVAAAAPHPDQDRATVARGDQALRTDPARYWRDAELQDAVFEARERLEALAGPFDAPRADGPRQRVREIEALLHDPTGAGARRYWSDPALREEYAQALSQLQGDGSVSPGDDGSSTSAAVAETPAETAAALQTI
jgi:hypothetical protein